MWCVRRFRTATLATTSPDTLFEDLDGPVKRLAALESPVACFPGLEDRILPQTEDVIREPIEPVAGGGR